MTNTYSVDSEKRMASMCQGNMEPWKSKGSSFFLLASPLLASVFCYLSLIISKEVDANCMS